MSHDHAIPRDNKDKNIPKDFPKFLISTMVPKQIDTTTFRKNTKQTFQTDFCSLGVFFLFFTNLIIAIIKQKIAYKYSEIFHFVPGPNKDLADENKIEDIKKIPLLDSPFRHKISKIEMQETIATAKFKLKLHVALKNITVISNTMHINPETILFVKETSKTTMQNLDKISTKFVEYILDIREEIYNIPFCRQSIKIINN